MPQQIDLFNSETENGQIGAARPLNGPEQFLIACCGLGLLPTSVRWQSPAIQAMVLVDGVAPKLRQDKRHRKVQQLAKPGWQSANSPSCMVISNPASLWCSDPGVAVVTVMHKVMGMCSRSHDQGYEGLPRPRLPNEALMHLQLLVWGVHRPAAYAA